MKTINVHECDVCGDYPKELDMRYEGEEYYEVFGFALRTCPQCKQLVCMSCRGDRHCCDQKADQDALELKEKETLFEIGE